MSVQERSSATTLAQVNALIESGRYEEAEEAARLLVFASQTDTGTESLETAKATDLFVEALLRNGKGAQTSTHDLAAAALRVKEVRLKPDDAGLSPSLSNLANTLLAAGDVPRSLPLFERALTVSERAHGPQDLATAEALDNLGRAQLQANRYDDAQRSLDRALRIKERLGLDDRRVARTLEQLALLLQNKGDYRGARPLLERSRRIREAVNPNDPELGDTLDLLGGQLLFEGEPQTARRIFIRALEVDQSTLRPDHPRIALAFRSLSSAATALGDFAEARSLRERALALAEKNYGVLHFEVVGYLNDLANTNLLQGDYANARVLYERAMKIVEDRRGTQDLILATFAYNLVILDGRLGDLAGARRQFDRAMKIWQRELGREHPYVARAVAALAGVLLDRGLDVEAQALYERALRIRERSLGPDHRDVARTLVYLATTLERQGQVSRARELSARAVRIWERSDAPDAPTFADILTNHANLQVRLGDFDSARDYYERALAIRSRVLGNTHPLFAETEVGLAEAMAGLGEIAPASALALQAEETARQHLRLTMRYLPESQSLDYAATRPKGIDLAISLSPAVAQPDPRVFDALIRTRALVLDELAARRHARTDTSRPDMALLSVALASARQRLANIVVRGASDQRPEQYGALVEDARREKELAERALADKSAAFRDELARAEIGITDVRAALPAHSALIAFARYDRTALPGAEAALTPPAKAAVASRRPSRKVPSYVAFVMRPDQPDISMVPLGSATSIDALVRRWHEEARILQGPSAQEAERTYRIAGTALRRRVWDPVATYLSGAATVFVVPDGTLNVMSFEALPVGRTRYVIDQGAVIHYLSAERDLVTTGSLPVAGRGLLAVGGAAFDDPTLFTGHKAKPKSPRVATVTSGVRGACGDLSSMQFEPLPGTRREAHEVATLWFGSPAQVLESRNASERAVKHGAPGHRVLHLATHGFFLGGDCVSAVGARSVGGLSTRPKNRSNAGLDENPLLLSGLALAGANRRAAAGPDDEDGILTAEEVAGLDLDGVEWAVLSACDTGLGEVKAGEGVFGLRRAFQVAGARTVIMSLWSVDDQAARAWMHALYEGRFQKHLATADAMHEASLKILRDRRTRGQSSHPFFWAGFVAAGDWR